MRIRMTQQELASIFESFLGTVNKLLRTAWRAHFLATDMGYGEASADRTGA